MDHLQDTRQLDHPIFDKKYKATVIFPTNTDVSWMDWVNKNTQNRGVDIQLLNDKVYVAFEDENDALIFKIRYL
jgi:hypothetical protein